MGYWFGYKALPDGAAVADGPYDNAEKASYARESRKASDMDVSPWFSAEDQAEADQIARWHLDGAPHPSHLKD